MFYAELPYRLCWPEAFDSSFGGIQPAYELTPTDLPVDPDLATKEAVIRLYESQLGPQLLNEENFRQSLEQEMYWQVGPRRA
jgi:hypothetical protein